MERKTAHDFDQELLILFDAYVHGGLDRRGFLEQASKYAVGGVTAAMLLEQLSPKFVEAQVVPPDDARIAPEYIEYESPNGYGKARGYFVRPEGARG
ncbi:MAG: dienelactone hydrolase family protein, partial [Gemmatimonadaceae bacterium]